MLIAQGVVEVSYHTEDGIQVIISHLGPGDQLGLIEAFSGRPCAANCTAFADSTVVFAPLPLLEGVSQQPAFIRNFAGLMHDLLMRENVTKAVDQFYTAEQRICSHLKQMTRFGAKFKQSQGYLAQAAGCSRQSVNRELKKLAEAGIITKDRSGIEVVDAAALDRRVHALGEIAAQ